MSNKCGCYHEIPDSTSGNCWGTRERDECSCRGDQTLCDFYPEVREKAREKHHIVYEIEKPTIDIHKIIDDAMTHKDRTVSVFTSDIGTTIKVTPLDENELCWVPETYADSPLIRCYYCPECHHKESLYMPYCANCGEKLKMPKENENG